MSTLQESRIIITGAAGGFGSAIVRRLARHHCRLALGGRDLTAVENIATEARTLGATALAAQLDVTDESSVRAFFGVVHTEFGGADVLINLPGLSGTARIAEMPVESYDEIVDVNLKGTFLAAKHFMPLADPARAPQLLLISSMAANRANPNAPVYCAAKAAVAMLAEALALQTAKNNLRVTTLKPGPVNTNGFWRNRPVPREKFMQPDDVAQVVEFVLTLPSHIVMHEIAFESFDFFKK